MPIPRRAFLAGTAACTLAPSLPARPAMDFWRTQRRGANGVTSKVRPEWFRAAGEAGLEFIRWSCAELPPAERDFLFGNCDNFQRIPEADLAKLRHVLDLSEENGLKIILVPFSLPGCRWVQKNGDKQDERLWRDERFHDQAFAFWQQLAAAVKDHPAVAGYNPLNEPHPERAFGFNDVHDPQFPAWFEQARDTPADLNRFNRRMVAAIRKVDAETPILLDGWFYAAPEAFAYLEPVDDERTIYALHNLGPWNFTTYRINRQRFAYPERMPNGREDTQPWTRANLEEIVRPVERFAEKYGIPAHRIMASEFWCDRRVAGAAAYIADEIAIYNERLWHWAFYAYRGDGDWGGLDYELGTAKLGWNFWQAVEKGEDADHLKNRHRNPVWNAISRHLRHKRK